MPRLRTNVLANYAGQVWTNLLILAFFPLYLRELGAERFGIVALLFSLQSLSMLLDLGVSMFMSRELARRLHLASLAGGIRSLVRSFEWLVWPMAVLLGALLALAAGPLAGTWLNPVALSEADATQALCLVAVAVAATWPTSFYNAVFTGLEQQPRMNALSVVFASLRFGGAVPVLLLDGGLQGFLAWHAVTAGAHSAVAAAMAWRLLPPADTAVGFRLAELAQARGFAARTFAITALAVVLSQLDRITLSALRPLAELGYYSIALGITAALGKLVQPIFNATYPRLSRHAADAQGEAAGTALYHLASQGVAVVVFPVAAVLCVYPGEILRLWTGNHELASTLALPMTLLVAGSALNGVLTVPYALQLANGWTRLAALGNLVALTVAAPLYYLLVQRHGMVGAAATWLLVNLGLFLLMVPLLHRRLIPGEAGAWYGRDVLPAMVATAVVTLAGRALMPVHGEPLSTLAWLALAGILGLSAAVLATADLRRLAFSYAVRRRRR